MNAPHPTPAPFVRWVGGSTRILPELRRHLPEDAGQLRYVDPFIGGGALFWDLLPDRALLSDACAPLMAVWWLLAQPAHDRGLTGVDDLVGDLQLLQAERDNGHLPLSEWYSTQRAYLNGRIKGGIFDRATRLRAASLFLALNRSCYNGLWRVNGDGAFNVALDPSKASTDLVREPLLQACAAHLQGMSDWQVHARSWEETLAAAGAGDLVYLDSPYDEEEESEQPGLFGSVRARRPATKYTAEGWTRHDLARLVRAAAEARDRGAFVIATNNATRFVLDRFGAAGFELHQVDVGRSVCPDAERRGAAREVIAVGAPR